MRAEQETPGSCFAGEVGEDIQKTHVAILMSVARLHRLTGSLRDAPEGSALDGTAAHCGVFSKGGPSKEARKTESFFALKGPCGFPLGLYQKVPAPIVRSPYSISPAMR